MPLTGLLQIVMCGLGLEALGPAKPSPNEPGQAQPNYWPGWAFGRAWNFGKPEPWA